MASIQELKAEQARLHRELQRVSKALIEAQTEASPVKVGDIFRRMAKRGYGKNVTEREERGRVVKFIAAYGEARPILRLLKKDGTDSLREREMYSFDKWEPIQSTAMEQ